MHNNAVYNIYMTKTKTPFGNKNKIITPTKNFELILTTYNQPRTGNYAFADEIYKSASKIYRHVNNFDAITFFPKREIDPKTKQCKNESGKSELDKNFNNYVIINPEEEKKFFPWYVGPQIVIKGDVLKNKCEQCYVCASSEHTKREECLTK